MYHSKYIGNGLSLYYGRTPEKISIENKYGVLAITTPEIILRDFKIYLSVPRPSFKQWFLSLWDGKNNLAGSKAVFLKGEGRKAYVYRYSVRIGCTPFSHRQISQINKYAEQFINPK